MCLLVVFNRMVDDAPLIVGANREEAFARGGEPPQLLDGSCRIIAGVDPTAGGTWLGVNEHGLLVAITNRQKMQAPAHPRSRGLLVRDLLALPDARAAAEHAIRALDKNAYMGCNLLIADRERLTVIHGADWLRVRLLPPGIHVLTANDVNDESDGRIGYSLWWLKQRDYQTSSQCIAALKELCSQNGAKGGPPICLRAADRGTVSSTIAAVRQPIARSSLWHAQGSPDKSPYSDMSELFRLPG